MDVDDSYRELGLTAESSDAEVKAAWRRLAARWHPDRNRNPQALKKIQRINRALEEIRKARGDAIAPVDTGANPERTVNHTVELTLEEAIAGWTGEINGELVDDCAECDGSGLEAQASPCPECDGAGQIRRHLWFGWMPSVAECGACAGQGVTRHSCSACEGTGKEAPRTYRCSVQVPPGARTGDVLHAFARVQGHKQKLACRVHVALRPHEFFEVQSDGTVTCEIPVDGFAWVANRWIEVPTPGGLRQMRLQRGHLVYRIRGQGLPPRTGGSASDCLVTVVPLFPDEFSAEQEAKIDSLIATNSKARGTVAGKRMAAWSQLVQKWDVECGKRTREAA